MTQKHFHCFLGVGLTFLDTIYYITYAYLKGPFLWIAHKIVHTTQQ